MKKGIIKIVALVTAIIIVTVALTAWYVSKKERPHGEVDTGDLNSGGLYLAEVWWIRGDRLKNGNLSDTIQVLEIMFSTNFVVNISNILIVVKASSTPEEIEQNRLKCYFDNGNIGDTIDASCLGSKPYNRTYETNYVAHAVMDKDHSFDDGDMINDAEDQHIITNLPDIVKVIINVSEERQNKFSLTSGKYIVFEMYHLGGTLFTSQYTLKDTLNFTNSSERYVDIWGGPGAINFVTPSVLRFANITGDRCPDSNPENELNESLRVLELTLELNQTTMEQYDLDEITFGKNSGITITLCGNYTAQLEDETLKADSTSAWFGFDNGEFGDTINATTKPSYWACSFVAYSITDTDHSFDNGDRINDETDNHTMNQNDSIKIIINLKRALWGFGASMLPDTNFMVSISIEGVSGFSNIELKTPTDYTGRYVYMEVQNT